VENQPLIVENLLISPKIHVENRENFLWKAVQNENVKRFSTWGILPCILPFWGNTS